MIIVKSNRAAFAMVPLFVVDACCGKALAALVWVRLRAVSDRSTGHVRSLTVPQIANLVGYGERATRQALADLEQMGLLVRYRKRYPDGERKGMFGRYHYRLVLERHNPQPPEVASGEARSASSRPSAGSAGSEVHKDFHPERLSPPSRATATGGDVDPDAAIGEPFVGGGLSRRLVETDGIEAEPLLLGEIIGRLRLGADQGLQVHEQGLLGDVDREDDEWDPTDDATERVPGAAARLRAYRAKRGRGVPGQIGGDVQRSFPSNVVPIRGTAS
jgi:hypothetical protein